MERITIKPTAKEIVLNGKPEDGHANVFSYNYEGSAANNLGGLFVVGQVQPANEDTSYMISLVASLAKREYYSQDSTTPKESFSKTLKKINEVLQDFFRNKDLAANIGIFAIAGDNIFISRLGKFKIILARDNQNIDILNNVTLFDKEHIQEKEFSNIISGKIMPKDKILAFYAGRAMTSREKNIKDLLIKTEAGEFADKINSIKQANDTFACAAIHITINKHKESAVVEPPQPRELRQSVTSQPILTQATAIPQTMPRVDLLPKDFLNVRPSQAKPGSDLKPTPPSSTKNPDNQTGGNVYYPGNINTLNEPSRPSKSKPIEPSSLIRPTEFSSAKKGNLLTRLLNKFNKFKPSGVYMIGSGEKRSLLKKKQVIILLVVIAVIIVAIIAKMTFAPALPIPGISSQEDEAMAVLISENQTKLQSALTVKDQNPLEARRMLFESLASLPSSVDNSEKINSLRTEILSALDEMDKVNELSPNLFQQVPANLGESLLTTVWKDKVFVYISNLDGSGGNLIEAGREGTGKIIPIKDFSPQYLTATDSSIIMINKAADSIGFVAIDSGSLKTSPLSITGSAKGFYPYQDNLYILTSDGIYKITDATKGKNSVVSWLNPNVQLPASPVSLAVDSKIFLINETGTLTTYYKGDKTAELSISIPVNQDSLFLTTKDSSTLYIVNKKLNRIYAINKTSGSLEKTIKIAGSPFIVSGAITNDGKTIYLLSQDNKVWQIVP
ncbi:MAG: hypothetical protein Q8Q89_04030 [bacterium]|nr:hypothetical protein [bacterium]